MIEVEYRRRLCIVVNKYKEEYDVNIQRGTIWGNPYRVDKDTPREEAINKYKIYIDGLIRQGTITMGHLESLRRMRLGCTCSPGQLCHGTILANIVNSTFNDPIQANPFIEIIGED